MKFMKLLRKASVTLDRTLDVLAALSCALLGFIMLSVCSDVAMRYFLNRSVTWIVEVNEYSLLYITFLAATWLLKREGHVKMEFLVDRLKPGNAALLNMTTSLLCTILCLVIVYYGVKVTWYNFQGGFTRPTMLEPPKFILLAIIPIGSFLLSLQFLRRTRGYLESWRASRGKKRELQQEA